MGDAKEKEYASGEWVPEGLDIKFNRVWGGHRFTDSEVADLLAGREITIECSGTKGTYKATGKLERQTFKGHGFIGFKKADASRGADGRILCPDGWCGHTFSEAEKELLEMGKTVEADDFISRKTGNTFPATVSLNQETGKIEPRFD